jgi:hypothetical protein
MRCNCIWTRSNCIGSEVVAFGSKAIAFDLEVIAFPSESNAVTSDLFRSEVVACQLGASRSRDVCEVKFENPSALDPKP